MHLRHYAKSVLINFLQLIVQIINQKIHLEMNIISVVPDFLFNDLEGFWQINQRIRGHHYNDTDLLQAPYKLSYQGAEIKKNGTLSRRKTCIASWGKQVHTVFLSYSACSQPSRVDFQIFRYTLQVKTSVIFEDTFLPLY